MVQPNLDVVKAHAGRSFRPVGASVIDGGVFFRVWAPKHAAVRVVIEDGPRRRPVSLAAEREAPVGFFSGFDEDGRAGDLYWFEINQELTPDPASRFQPRGVEGPSQVIDPRRYAWQSGEWRRPVLRGRVIYELHIGTFTPEGTFAGAMARLGELADLGVNTIELMPLGDFPGRFNWGYDGVMIHAPARCYGGPDELRALVDAAHARGLAVIVDAVYNHLGPCGNVLPRFSDDYFHPRHSTGWGSGLNFDGPNSEPVRQFFLQNACLWLDEYRVDGLRLDAVHAIHDESASHLIAEVAGAAHARGAFVIAEDERNDARTVMPAAADGWGVDGVWSDDFHHSMRVALTGDRASYFANYTGTRDEWVETLRVGWLYQGQYFPTWNAGRGTPGDHLSPEQFILAMSNHDQVGNRPLGDRLNQVVAPDLYRTISMLGCLLPYTPLLFMGQEWAATTPFPFFCELPGAVGAAMKRHRLEEFQRPGAGYSAVMLARMPDPQAETTFHSAKLNWAEREQPSHAAVLALYRECLRIRAANPIFQSAPRSSWRMERAGDRAVMLTWSEAPVRWALVVSIYAGVSLQPPGRPGWELALSSNEDRFGGQSDRVWVGPGAALWRTKE